MCSLYTSIVKIINTCINGKVNVIPLESHKISTCTGAIATTLSTQGVVYVCNGGLFEVMCTIDGDLLLWSSSVLLGSNGYALQSLGRSVTEVRQINSTQLIITRVSASPLTSTLSLNPVTDGLNGAEIRCVDLNSMSTTINVVNASDSQGKYICCILLVCIYASA